MGQANLRVIENAVMNKNKALDAALSQPGGVGLHLVIVIKSNHLESWAIACDSHVVVPWCGRAVS